MIDIERREVIQAVPVRVDVSVPRLPVRSATVSSVVIGGPLVF